MKNLKSIILIVICCITISCSKEVDSGIELVNPAPPQLEPGFKVDNRPGLKIYESIYKDYPEINLCVSPFSITTCLSLIANGAAGEDLAEIFKVLDYKGLDINSINNNYLNLAEFLNQRDPMVVYEQANSFWYDAGISVKKDFKDDLELFYDSEVYKVDFSSPKTVNQINNWVADKTHDKIEQIVSFLPPGTIMSLMNAIYFNGEWTHKFKRSATKPWRFNKLDGYTVRIGVMENKQAYRYYEHPSWYGMEMTYGSGDWAMYLFLPKRIMQLDKLTSWIVEDWDVIREQFESDQPIKVYIPQFEIENDFGLNDILQKLGMNKVFNPGADFSRMLDESVFLGRVIHKTYLKVNEDGTEAAAVTGGFPLTGSPSGLFFDHPFLYLIAEQSTGLILFIGQVTDPSK